ncbi:MAG: hypothetical protein J5995_08980 [Muribaculaceae bacterium]|nr:hypothetical protein [Muribaculaceae bacterium]
MNELNEALNLCLCKMKASSDFSDSETTIAVKKLLSVIIGNPKLLVNFPNEEKLSLVLSSIITSSFPQVHPTYEGMNVRNVVFVCGYYLYMHQLETGYFYDRNWPAFILLLHVCQSEFAKFSLDMNPFAPERIQQIMGKGIDYGRLTRAAKGVELNMMLVAKNTGYLTSDIYPWYEELIDDYDNLLSNADPFREVAIPLYQSFGNYFKSNDLSFANI